MHCFLYKPPSSCSLPQQKYWQSCLSSARLRLLFICTWTYPWFSLPGSAKKYPFSFLPYKLLFLGFLTRSRICIWLRILYILVGKVQSHPALPHSELTKWHLFPFYKLSFSICCEGGKKTQYIVLLNSAANNILALFPWYPGHIAQI